MKKWRVGENMVLLMHGSAYVTLSSAAPGARIGYPWYVHSQQNVITVFNKHLTL
jgi:hypothetical protein